MTKKYQLVIITVTYKPKIEELQLFIESFRRYNDIGNDAKLIIVDNSPEKSWDSECIISQNQDVDFIFNPANPGFGASNNLGFERYESDYALFINNDVEFTESVFQGLIGICEKDKSIGCIGIHQDGGAPSFFKKFDAPKYITNKEFIDRYHFISGAFMFFRSSIFKQCGCYDENIFMYWEEYDISTRLLLNGYKTLYCPQYSFLHKVGNRRVASRKLWEIGTKSFCYVCKKYGKNCKKHQSSIRLYILLIYNILKCNFRQVIEIVSILKMRKRLFESL